MLNVKFTKKSKWVKSAKSKTKTKTSKVETFKNTQNQIEISPNAGDEICYSNKI